jgi:hypothetical protein
MYSIGSNTTNRSLPLLTDVEILSNTVSVNGGGIYNGQFSSPVLVNVIVAGNSAVNGGGGGIYNTESPWLALVNVRISGNVAQKGGGLFNNSTGATVSPKLINVTIAGNEALNYGGGVYNLGLVTLRIRNSIIWWNWAGGGIPSSIYNESGATSTIGYSIVLGTGDGSAGTGDPAESNMETDPLYANYPTSSPIPNIDGSYLLASGSPAIDEGLDDNYPDTWEKWQSLIGTDGVIDTQTRYDDYIAPYINTDLGGNNRFQPPIDMGAYEF